MALLLVLIAIGALVLLAVALVAYREGGRSGDAPWWFWLGGVFGAFYVTAALAVGPRLGATVFFGILVAAQLTTSVVLDRFGWLGFPQQAVSPGRLAGVALLVVGAVLVRVF